MFYFLQKYFISLNLRIIMKEDCAEIDLSEQINNPWSKDTSLAIKKKRTYFSVKIKGKDKNYLKSKFIRNVKTRADRKHNQQVIVIIYCFLLYHLLKITEGLSREIKICNDVSPTWAVNKNLDAICMINKEILMTHRFRLRFKKKGDGNSKAHHIAKDVAKGRIPANIIFKKQHIEILSGLIKKIM